MARWIVAGLIVLNVLLGVGVYLRWEPKANAQIGKGTGEYATVAGTSYNQSIVYILEVNTGKLVAVRTDGGKVMAVAAHDVSADIKRLK